MGFQFASCDRQRVLGFLRKLYPNFPVSDTPDCAGPVLDYVAADVIRILDPDMHGFCTNNVVASANWDHADQSTVIASLKAFHELATKEPANV